MADGLEKDMSSGPEVVVMGRLSADIYPAQIRTPLREQRNYVRYVGGFAGNVSTGLARLQVRTAIVSKVGNDGHGEFIRDFLTGEAVDAGWLRIDHTLNTPVVFCEIWPPDRFPLLFYRTPTCPDWELTTDDFDLESVAEAPILLVSGTGLAREKSRVAHMAALERHRHTTIFDLDYRPTFWSEAEEYRRAVREPPGARTERPHPEARRRGRGAIRGRSRRRSASGPHGGRQWGGCRRRLSRVSHARSPSRDRPGNRGPARELGRGIRRQPGPLLRSDAIP